MYFVQYLMDQKCRVKKRKAEVTRSVRKTGGGKANVPDLPDDEEKLLAAMGGAIVIEGDTSIEEYGIELPVSNNV